MKRMNVAKIPAGVKHNLPFTTLHPEKSEIKILHLHDATDSIKQGCFCGHCRRVWQLVTPLFLLVSGLHSK